MNKFLSVMVKTLIYIIIILLAMIVVKNIPTLSKRALETYQKAKTASNEVNVMQFDIQNIQHINQEHDQIQKQYHDGTQNIPRLQDFPSFLESFLTQVKNQGLVVHNTNIQKPIITDNNTTFIVEMSLSGSYDQFLSLLNLISAHRYLINAHHWTLTRAMAPATTVLSNDENKNNIPDQLNIEVAFEFVVLKD